MTPTLQQHLQDAKATLDQVHTVLTKKTDAASIAIEETFRPVVGRRSDTNHWLTMIDARTAVWQLLDGLENKAHADELVPFIDTRVEFVHVRQLGVQAYLATTWALADQITGMAGRVLCTPDSFNDMRPAKLVSHFINKGRKSKTASAMCNSLRQAFGWPVGVSYAIRNHFVHGGDDQIVSPDFFEASTAASAFRISVSGWARIVKTARDDYKVDTSLHRAHEDWPKSPCNDLRKVLRACEREMDKALGVIIGSACHTLRAHVGLMLGEDPREVERGAHKP